MARDDGFAEFVLGSSGLLRRSALALVGDEAAAEELVRRVLERMYVGWPRIDDPSAYAQRALTKSASGRGTRTSGDTSDLLPARELLAVVRRGGQQRRHRRNKLLALSLVATLVVGAVVAVIVLRPPPAVRYTGPLFDGRTHGDLAHDTAYQKRVIAVWRGSHASGTHASEGVFDDLKGNPRVVWAGSTTAGPAAVVAQDAYLHRHGNLLLDHEGVFQLLGFIGVDGSGQPRVVGDTYRMRDSVAETAWVIDPARTVVATIANGTPYAVSFGWRYLPGGVARRGFTPMADHDGVALAPVPASARPGLLRVMKAPYADFADVVLVQGLPPSSSQDGDQLLDWHGTTDLSGPTTNVARRSFFLALARLRTGLLFEASLGGWSVTGSSDGRRFFAGEISLDRDVSQLYVVFPGAIGPDEVVSAGSVDRRAVLPLQVRLPDGEWLVARYGAALSYRVGDGPWVRAHRDAALLPRLASEVRVVVGKAAPKGVTLHARG